MTAIILRAPSIERGSIHHRPPLGVHLIASELRQPPFNYAVTVIDSLVDDITPEQAAESCTFFGQSSTYHSLPRDIEFLNAAKRANPRLFAFFGGPGAAMQLDFVFANSLAAGVFQGDDPLDLLPIFEWKPWMAPGFIYRIDRPRPMSAEHWAEAWARVNWQNIPIEKYWQVLDGLGWEHRRTMHVITASHCRKSCTFCSFPALRRDLFGYKPEFCALLNQDVYEIIRRQAQTYPGLEQIFFHDDDFFSLPDRERFFASLPDDLLRLKLGYLVQGSADSIEHILPRFCEMAEAGVKTLCLGVENIASKELGKQPSKAGLLRIADKAAQVGITPYFYMILFTPDETMGSLLENLHFCRAVEQIGGKVSISLGVWALPGTELTNRCEANRATVNIEGKSVSYRTTLRVRDHATADIHAKVRQKLNTLIGANGCGMRAQYTQELLACIEQEIKGLKANQLYGEIR